MSQKDDDIEAILKEIRLGDEKRKRQLAAFSKTYNPFHKDDLVHILATKRDKYSRSFGMAKVIETGAIAPIGEDRVRLWIKVINRRKSGEIGSLILAIFEENFTDWRVE